MTQFTFNYTCWIMTADNVAHLKNTICQELKAVIILLIHLPDQFLPQAGVYVCVCVSSPLS